MESNIDIKELWNRQAVPVADQSEILNKISRFRKSGLKKGIFLDVILVLTILFMIFIWIYFKPQFLRLESLWESCRCVLWWWSIGR